MFKSLRRKNKEISTETAEQLIDEEIAKSGAAVQMFEIEIEHLSGKEIQER